MAADDQGTANRFESQDKAGVKYEVIWVNDLPLNQINPGLKVNFLWCVITAPGKEPTAYSWVTDREINEANVLAIARAGRSRWQIEDSFNTLKNRGYNLRTSH